MIRRASVLLGVAWCALAQGLDPQAILHPKPDSWPTYNGDYSGQRFSALRQIDTTNVGMLTLSWAFQTDVSTGPGLKSTPLLVNGTLYFTEPDDVWAVDARSGQQLWHYRYHANEGLHIGQRGLGMYQGHLYFETPDAHLLSLDARSGEMQWDVELADVKLGYWATMAPLIIGRHVIVGVSGDFTDLHGFIDSFDPDTGKLQWRWDALPKPGQPGADTWPKGTDAIAHGGGMTWITGTYDPSLNLLYWGTGNPNPVLAGYTRPGDNLFTCTIVALNPDTGKLVWYFQPSPHDVHDWDAVQTPVLVDADFHGAPRKLLIQASRNGYLFVLDRATGKALLSAPYEEINWSKGVDATGRPIADASKNPSPAGTLVEPDALGATNWMPPSFDPETGLLYVDTHRSFSIYYDLSSGKPEGFAGRDLSVWARSSLKAIDYQTGATRWQHDLGPGDNWASVLSTAGGLVFTGDVYGNILALDARTGKTLWHASGGGQAQAPPITYLLDDRQYILIGCRGVLYAWALPEALLRNPRPAAATASPAQSAPSPARNR
ncbi:MAG: acido-empty-quinoprotein group A [Acidobacteriaceae bacterium]|nr:acido-empty-quinoprotein group A [Acidobacteriaceae bacterium]